LKAGIADPGNTAIARKWQAIHAYAVTNNPATTERFVGSGVFYAAHAKAI
jgi:hypothetical protein